MSLFDINNITVLNSHGIDYCRMIVGINKNEAIYFFKNCDLNKKHALCEI